MNPLAMLEPILNKNEWQMPWDLFERIFYSDQAFSDFSGRETHKTGGRKRTTDHLGSSSGMFCSTLPTRSAPTSAAFV